MARISVVRNLFLTPGLRGGVTWLGDGDLGLDLDPEVRGKRTGYLKSASNFNAIFDLKLQCQVQVQGILSNHRSFNPVAV